jgi:RHS repeat-associated protein
VRYVRDYLNGSTANTGDHWVEIEVWGTANTAYIGNYFEWTGSTNTMTKYYYAGGQRVAVRRGSTLSLLISDHLGSTAYTADPVLGRRWTTLRYKAWGEQRYAEGFAPTEFHFTGQRELAVLGLHDYGARWYDSLLGRFIQPDTVVPLGSQGVQAWDRFAYVNNNPVRYTDPTGRCIDGISTYFCIVAAGAAIGALVSYGTQVAGNIANNGWSGAAFTNVDVASIGSAAVAGAVGAGVGLAGSAIAGAGLTATLATGSIGGVLSGQASRASLNILTGQNIGKGLGNPTDMLIDGGLGGITSYVGYEAGRLISSTGTYGTTGGHHIHAKSAFGGHPAYNADDAISVSNQYMRSHGWSHGQITGTQHTLYNELASSGLPNTMTAQNNIAYGSLRAGGASPISSWYLVQRSSNNLARQGVRNPTKIPWN